LPFVNGTLIGTTDEPFEGDPEMAVATPRELAYLVRAVNDVFGDLNLTTADIDMHYAGVRPLPFSDANTPAAISRRHWIEPNPHGEVPFYSIIGGKLTTCRSLAEESTDTILQRLGLPRTGESRERRIPSNDFQSQSQEFAEPLLTGTRISVSNVRRIIRDEWVSTLDDLVERRLMLLYHPQLQRATLDELAQLLVEANLLRTDEHAATVSSLVHRLADHFGKHVI
jgi:glycerol-3-phosphate dehydrogenase